MSPKRPIMPIIMAAAGLMAATNLTSRTNQRESRPNWLVGDLKSRATAKRKRRAAKPGASAYAKANVR